MLLCARCRYRHEEVRPIMTPDGREKYVCIDRQACNQRKKWNDLVKKKRRQWLKE